MAAQTEALSRLDVTPDVGHGPDETGSPRDDYVLVDSGESETPEPKTPAGAGAAASSWSSPQELSLRVPDAPAPPSAAAIQPLQVDKRMLAAWEAAQQTEAAPQAPLIAQDEHDGEQGAAADADAACHQASPADASGVAKPAATLDSGAGPSRSAASAQEDAPTAPRAAIAEEEDESLWVKPERMWVGASQPGSPQSSTAAAREQEERAGLEALEDLCAAAPESPRSAPLRAALAGLRRENGRLRAALEEAGLQQEWVLGSVVKSSEADRAQLVAGLREMTDQRDALLQELKHSETQFAGMVAEALDVRIRHLEAVLLGAPAGDHPALRPGAPGPPLWASSSRTGTPPPRFGTPPPRAMTPPPLPLPPAMLAGAQESVQRGLADPALNPNPTARPPARRALLAGGGALVRPASLAREKGPAVPGPQTARAAESAGGALAAVVAEAPREQAHSFLVRPANAAAARAACAAALAPNQAPGAARPLRAGLALARGLFRRASARVGGLLGAAGCAVGQAGHVLGSAGQASAGRLVHAAQAAPAALTGRASGVARAAKHAAARLDAVAAQVAAPLRRSALEGAVVVRQRAHAARVQLGAGVAAAGQSLGVGARRFRQRMDQARRRLVSASRMAAHAAGYHLGRMQSAAMRTFDSPAAQGYCKVAAAVAFAALVGAAVTEAATALLGSLADARAERRAQAALAQQLAALVARAVAEPSSSLEFLPKAKGADAKHEAASASPAGAALAGAPEAHAEHGGGRCPCCEAMAVWERAEEQLWGALAQRG